MKRIIIIFLLIIASATNIRTPASAQCAMCTIAAEQGVKNGNTQSKGLNTGVLYLMSIPYLLIGGLGVLWYLKFRKKTSSPVSV
jgi:hypothetical protein